MHGVHVALHLRSVAAREDALLLPVRHFRLLCYANSRRIGSLKEFEEQTSKVPEGGGIFHATFPVAGYQKKKQPSKHTFQII